MKSYSPLFQTIYDEQEPTVGLGRGTHYSILRAVVWKDSLLNDLKKAMYYDFAVIWDEDHDERVINVIEKIYTNEYLTIGSFFGERKGGLTIMLSNNKFEDCIKYNKVYTGIENICEGKDPFEEFWDPWNFEVNSLGNLINDQDRKIQKYLNTINHKLGFKDIEFNSIQYNI